MKVITNRSKEDRQAEYYTRWAELNWCITFVTVCRHFRLGKDRARKLFFEIKDEMTRFNEYNDYNYSMKELNAELERLEIPFQTGYTSSQGARYDINYRDRMTKKNQTAASIAENREIMETLKLMKELM